MILEEETHASKENVLKKFQTLNMALLFSFLNISFFFLLASPQYSTLECVVS